MNKQGYYEIDFSNLKFEKNDWSDEYTSLDGGVTVKLSPHSSRAVYKTYSLEEWLDTLSYGTAIKYRYEDDLVFFKTTSGWIKSDGSKVSTFLTDYSPYDFEVIS